MGSSLPVILAAGDPGYTPINFGPEGRLEIAWNAGYLTPAADRVWTDVSDRVERGDLGGPISIERGRADQHSTVQPSRLTVTLNNSDGGLTPEFSGSPFFPNVKKGRPIRYSVTTVAGTAFIRFTGYIDVIPVAWPTGADTYSSVTISATSRMARLGKSLEFRSIVEEEILYDRPTGYWTLGEPAGALEAGNIAPGRSERLVVTQRGTGGTLEFGAGTGPGTDGLTAPIFTPASAGNGLYLAGVLAQPVNASADTVIDLECFFVTSAVTATLIRVASDDNTESVEIEIGPGGTLFVSCVIGGQLTQATLATVITDGLLHYVHGRLLRSGTSLTASIILDGGARTSDASPATIDAAAPLPSFTRLYAGLRGPAFTALFNGTLAHFAAYSGTSALADARITEHYHAGADGFTADSSDERIARYARLAGIPAAEIATETGLSTSIAHKDTTGQTAVSMMEAVAKTEDGIVFDGSDGALTFHARSHRYNATSAFTLDCAAQEVEANLLPVLDDQGLLNDVKATREGGAEAHSVNQASIDELGYYRDTFDLMTTSDNEVQSRADWEVNRRGTPRVKLTSVSVDLVASSLAQQALLLAADIGTRFTVTNLPAQAPASTMDFFVEGINDDIGPESFTVTFNTSAAAYADVWILDSSTQSQLDSTTVLAY